MFTLAGKTYTLPISRCTRSTATSNPASAAQSDYSARGVISLRGRIMPVLGLAARLDVDSELGEHSKIVIVDDGSQTVRVIVDAVKEALTVTHEQPEQDPTGTDSALIDAIAKLGDRPVVLLPASTIFTALDTAA